MLTVSAASKCKDISGSPRGRAICGDAERARPRRHWCFLASGQAYSLSGSARHHGRSRVDGQSSSLPTPPRGVTPTPCRVPSGFARRPHPGQQGKSRCAVPTPPRTAAPIAFRFPSGFAGRRHRGPQGEDRCAAATRRGALSPARPHRLPRPGIGARVSASTGRRDLERGVARPDCLTTACTRQARSASRALRPRPKVGGWRFGEPVCTLESGAAPAALISCGRSTRCGRACR